MASSHKNTNALILEQLKTADVINGAVLDLGSGKGDFCRALIRERDGKPTTGALDACDIHYDLDLPEVRFKQCDANAGLPYDDSQFDAIVAIEVFEHTRVPYQVLCDVARILKPGGILAFSVPNVGHMLSRFTYVLNGHFTLYPAPTSDPKYQGSIGGHVSPFPFQYWHYGLRWAGFGEIRMHRDRGKRSAAALAGLVWPLTRLSTALRLRRLKDRSAYLYPETKDVVAEANSWKVMTSRSLVFVAHKPGH